MKTLFKNAKLSLMRSMVLLLSPLVLIVLITIAYLGSQMYVVYNDATNVYYDTLYNINSDLINGDRDFYQAMMGATQYYDLYNGYGDIPENMLQDYLDEKLDEYKENKDQVLERVHAAVAIAKEDPDIYTQTTADGDSKNFETYDKEFEADFAEWEKSYDVEKGTGDWSTFNISFETARSALSGMTDIVEKWAEEEKGDLRDAIVHKIMISGIIMGLISS